MTWPPIGMSYNEFCAAMGRELRRIRRESGWSRQRLADRSGISRSSIERYEAGDDMPVMSFIRLCVALGESCGAFLDRVLLAARNNATNEPESASERRTDPRRRVN